MQVMKVEQPREEDSGITLGTGPAAEGRERYKSRLKLYGQNLQAMNHSPLALPQYYLENAGLTIQPQVHALSPDVHSPS